MDYLLKQPNLSTENEPSASLVFHSCDETHIFNNDEGSVTIKQKNAMGDDVYIVIPTQYIESVVRALRNAKRESLGLGN